MSHCVTLDVELTDLESLKRACERLGFEFRQGQKTYQWWGHWVGDYPLPKGFTKEELGTCEHAIRVPGAKYEIGVVRAKSGPGWTLIYDFYSTGGLVPKLGGQKAERLVQAYGAERYKAVARRKGFRVVRDTVLADGTVSVMVEA